MRTNSSLSRPGLFHTSSRGSANTGPTLPAAVVAFDLARLVDALGPLDYEYGRQPVSAWPELTVMPAAGTIEE